MESIKTQDAGVMLLESKMPTFGGVHFVSGKLTLSPVFVEKLGVHINICKLCSSKLTCGESSLKFAVGG